MLVFLVFCIFVAERLADKSRIRTLLEVRIWVMVEVTGIAPVYQRQTI